MVATLVDIKLPDAKRGTTWKVGFSKAGLLGELAQMMPIISLLIMSLAPHQQVLPSPGWGQHHHESPLSREQQGSRGEGKCTPSQRQEGRGSEDCLRGDGHCLNQVWADIVGSLGLRISYTKLYLRD